MADTLYLSLWYPNLRLEALAGKLIAVLGAFAGHGGEAKVYSATVWPVSWNETPVFEHVWGRSGGGTEAKLAVEEAAELLHDDYAYEFQIGWSLWELETEDTGLSASVAAAAAAQDHMGKVNGGLSTPRAARFRARGDSAEGESAGGDARTAAGREAGGTNRWVRAPRLVWVTGFGPLFDEGAYEQEGHIKVDFGSDAPFLEEDADLSQVGAKHVEENVRQLVELTAAMERGSGATARLLWSELGESLAQRLAARLRAGN